MKKRNNPCTLIYNVNKLCSNYENLYLLIFYKKLIPSKKYMNSNKKSEEIVSKLII